MLVWKLVRIHKGKISIESVENKAPAKVIFPKNNSEVNGFRQKTVQQENVVPVSPKCSLSPTYKDQYRQHVQNAQRILVVEDHDDLRMNICLILYRSLSSGNMYQWKRSLKKSSPN